MLLSIFCQIQWKAIWDFLSKLPLLLDLHETTLHHLGQTDLDKGSSCRKRFWIKFKDKKMTWNHKIFCESGQNCHIFTPRLLSGGAIPAIPKKTYIISLEWCYLQVTIISTAKNRLKRTGMAINGLTQVARSLAHLIEKNTCPSPSELTRLCRS